MHNMFTLHKAKHAEPLLQNITECLIVGANAHCCFEDSKISNQCFLIEFMAQTGSEE